MSDDSSSKPSPEPQGGDGTDPSAERPPTVQPRSGPSRLGILVPAIALVVGLALGGAFVALTGFGVTQDSASGAQAGGQATLSSSPTDATTTLGPTPTDLLVTVPSECLLLTEDSQKLLDLVDQAVTAARDLDATALSGIVSQLQQAEVQLRAQTDACRSAAAASP